jgi:hypothetical protein
MSKLIPGIFNYCDRWCERCEYTDRCRLFQSEAERNIRHILNDEDPNDPEIIMRDVAESIDDAMAMLDAQMEIEGISGEDLEDDDAEDSQYFIDDFDDERGEVNESGRIVKTPHPLAVQSDDFYKDVLGLFNKMKSLFQDDPDAVEPVNNPLYEDLKILLWYSPQISVKIRMCAGSKLTIENEKDEEEIEFEVEMMNINSRIAFTGMEKCLNSLQNIYNSQSVYHDEILPLLSLMKKIKDGFEKEFPAVHTFKRPYFD